MEQRINPVASYIKQGGFHPVPYLQQDFLYRDNRKLDGSLKREFYFYRKNFLLVKVPIIGIVNMIMATYVVIPFPELTFECDLYRIVSSFTWDCDRGLMEVKLWPSDNMHSRPGETHILQFRLMPEYPVTLGFNLTRAHNAITTKKKLRKFLGLKPVVNNAC